MIPVESLENSASSPGLIDSHCHLFMNPLADDLSGVMVRCTAAGVTDIIVPAVDAGSWSAIAELSSIEGIHAALGLHPWDADQHLDIDHLREILDATGSVAVGEIGLDFKIASPLPDRQMDVFRRQLDLAVQTGLPVILHCRGAFEEMISMLSEDKYSGLSGVVHAFTRSPELAGRFLDLGYFLSFGGALTRPGAKRTRRSAESTRLDRIILETDSPSIGMDGIPPEEVEPSHVRLVAQALAHIRGISPEEVADITTDNVRRLFRLEHDD